MTVRWRKVRYAPSSGLVGETGWTRGMALSLNLRNCELWVGKDSPADGVRCRNRHASKPRAASGTEKSQRETKYERLQLETGRDVW
jgi:hypothetical protein